MVKQLELATVKAGCHPLEGFEIYWLFSRSQVDFVFQELELVKTEGGHDRAEFQGGMLPVIWLEKYFGLQRMEGSGEPKYVVISGVSTAGELTRIIFPAPHSLKLHKLESELKPVPSFVLPEKSDDILGVYSLSKSKLAIVPDIGKITRFAV